MLSSHQFLTGLAAGAVIAWWAVRRRSHQMIAATPYYPKAIRRQGRLGGAWSQMGGWTASGGKGSYR